MAGAPELENERTQKPTGRVRREVLTLHLGVLALLSTLSLWLFHSLWIGGHPGSMLLLGEVADSSQQVWFLGFAAHSLEHLSSPFVSTLMYAGQGGFNALSQTSDLAVGYLLAPVTWLLGPIAASNLATILAPVATGYAAFCCLRTMTSSPSGQILGATFYAFIPATLGPAQGGHLMLTLLVYPPVVLALFYDLLVTKRRSPRRIGVLLGLATILQFFIGTEVLAMTAVVVVIGLLVTWALAPRGTMVPWRALGTAGSAAGILSGVVLAYPLWVALAGPQHVTGPAWPLVPYSAAHVGDLVSFVRTNHGLGYPGTGRNLNESYLGWAVLAVLAASTLVWKRLAWVLAVTGVLTWTLTLGRAFASTSWWANFLPMRQLSKLPLFDAVIPQRFVLLEDLVVAVLLALSVDGWLRLHRERTATTSATWTRLTRAGIVIVLSASLLPLAVGYRPLTAAPVHEPWWFTHRSHSIPPTANVLVFPSINSMLWQASEGFPFRLVGGYAIIPDRNGQSSTIGVQDPLDWFIANAENLGQGLQPLNQSELQHAQDSLRRRKVTHVVVLTKNFNAGYVASTMVALLGRAPKIDHRVMVWADVSATLPQFVPPHAARAVDACALTHRRSASVAATCTAAALGLS